jgi:NADP-dependent 3-hydroxy acid dehydrogenase YdfG
MVSHRQDGEVAVPRVVLVTGAAGLLASAVVRQLALDGERVALVDVDSDRVEQFAHELGKEQQTIAFPVDVTDADQVDKAVALTIDAWGRLDAVVHAAGGLLGVVAPVLDYPTDAWRSSLDINLTGLSCSRRAAGSTPRGTIIPAVFSIWS